MVAVRFCGDAFRLTGYLHLLLVARPDWPQDANLTREQSHRALLR